MASKFSKVLFGSAVAGAAIAGGLAYLLKKKEKDNSWDEDLEDFDDNMTEEKKNAGEDEPPISREYVTIHTEPSRPEESDGDEDASAEDHEEEALDEEEEEDEESSEDAKPSSSIKDSVAAAMQNVADRVDNDIAESMAEDHTETI